jgi:PAS domain S-box-containing protein
MAVQETVENCEPYSAEFRFIRPDGATIWLSGHDQLSQTLDGERIIGGVNHDITDLCIEQ